MSSTGVEYEAANCMLPAINKASSDQRGARMRTAAIAITATSTAFDLSTYLTQWDQGHFLSLVADGADVYYAMSDSNADTVDPAVTTAGAITLCQKIANGTRWDGRVPDDYKYLIARTSSGTATLRVSISSYWPTQSLKNGDL